VAGSAPPGPRAADRNILDVAGQGGVYRPSEHLERARTAIDRIGGDPEAFVRSHVRRLEALRRAGHAERIDADHWRVPADLPARGQAYDLARDRANIRISILSPGGLDSQIGPDGATWLDRELASPDRTTLANTGFGREVTEAMARRRQSLVNMGQAVRLEDGRIRVSKDFIANLERAEVNRVGKAMAAERGLTFTAAKSGEYVSGTLVGSTQLASGRFAMTASASNWCRGSPFSTSASASISPAQCATLVASNGISAGNGGWGYKCPQCRYLLVAMGPDRRHPLKARALRAPGSAGSRP
jgi:Protein of unknown function (DUF3363)